VELALRPLRADELPDYLARGQESYARDMVAHAGISEEAARVKAEHDWHRLLPDGLASTGQYLFALENRSTGERVGDLWFAEQAASDFGEQVAFIYSIEIFEEFRGRGRGRQAMQVLEDEVRSRGLGRIALNVFGGNDIARSLYRSVGYAETAVFMSKAL
jgi:ribosomal protein S18 acetylase RimI-like enzyme